MASVPSWLNVPSRLSSRRRTVSRPTVPFMHQQTAHVPEAPLMVGELRERLMPVTVTATPKSLFSPILSRKLAEYDRSSLDHSLPSSVPLPLQSSPK